MMLPPARLRLVAGLLIAWAVAVGLRLAQVQLLQHEAWSREAAEQQRSTVEVEQPRGEVRTRDGRILAGSLERRALGVSTRLVPRGEWSAVARALAPIVGAPAPEVLARLRDADGFLYLSKDLDPEVEPAVARLGQPGVWTERVEQRAYPNGTFAGALVGFVNAAGVGQAGLEASFESTLRGVPSVYHQVRDGKTRGTAVDRTLASEGRPGLSLRLTIDSRIQLAVEQELESVIRDVDAAGAAAVVLDPRTGQLLAVASLPSYDPARPGKVPPEWRRNRAVEDLIEPGSTFKPVIVAAALAAGVLSPAELVDCSGGGIQVADIFIRDHANFGLLPVRQVLAQSSNAGSVRIAHRIPPAQLDRAIRALGFGRVTGVELPAEARGLYRPPERWSAVSRAGLALGQEIAVSALQLAQAYGAIANDGRLVPPTLVLETVDERSGEVITPYAQRPAQQVLPVEVARAVAAMLQETVDDGTGIAARVAGYAVAGKTGTAQKAATRGGYAAGVHASWFAGFLPREDPRLVIVVCVDAPSTAFWASEVAAPAFGRIATRLVRLVGLPPRPGERA